MRSWKIASLPALALLLVPASFALPSPLAAETAPPDRQDPELVIEDHMIQIGRNLRRLKREVGDPAKKEKVLERLVIMQTAATQAKTKVPILIQESPESKQPAMLQEYRGMQIDFMRSLLDLEEVVLEGDHQAAKERLDTVIAWEDKGHAKFNPDS